MRFVIFTLLIFILSASTVKAQDCLAESGFLGVSGFVAQNETFVFAECNDVEVAVSGNNTLSNYSQAFFVTQGANNTIVDTLFNLEGAFTDLMPGEYCLHALNYNNEVNIPSLPNIGGNLNILFQNPNSCFSLNNAGNTSEAANACVPITILEPIQVFSEHECSTIDDGIFLEIFTILGGLPQYSSEYDYYVSGVLNYSNGISYDDAQNIIVDFPDNTQIVVIVTDAAQCDTIIYQPTYGACIKTVVELNYLRAETVESNNLITWATATENQNDYFILSVSYDGENFETLDIINGAGTTATGKEYSYIDYSTRSGETYYSLKAVDENGYVTDFDIINVSRAEDNFVINSVSPTPATEEVTINFNSNMNGIVDYEIYNLTGKMVEAGTFIANTGNNNITLNIGNFNTGIYLFNLNNGKEAYTSKIIKR